VTVPQGVGDQLADGDQELLGAPAGQGFGLDRPSQGTAPAARVAVDPQLQPRRTGHRHAGLRDLAEQDHRLDVVGALPPSPGLKQRRVGTARRLDQLLRERTSVVQAHHPQWCALEGLVDDRLVPVP
jgi:hypothetical protein